MSATDRRDCERYALAPAPPVLKTGFQYRVVVGSLMLATSLVGLDNNIVNTALPRITRELHQVSHLSWIITSFMLGQCSVMPIYGKMSDLYGRKRLLIFAVALFLLGSGLCGLSRSLIELAGFRAIQGVGASGITILSSTIAADLAKPEQRGRLLGLFMGAFAASSLAGPLVGGAITSWIGWRWVFYINLPLGLVVLGFLTFLFEAPSKNSNVKIDYLGSVLLIAAAACLIFSLSLVDTHDLKLKLWGWPLFGAFISFTALLIVQVHRAAEPILSPRLFHRPRFVACILTSFSVAFPFFGAIVFMPLYLQVVGGLSPLASGLALTPQIIGLVISSRAGGWFLARKANYAFLINLGVVGVALGLFLIGIMMEFHRNLLCLETALLVLGLGGGLVRPNLIIAAQTAVSQSETGAATSTLIFVHTLSGTIGVACAQTLMNARLRSLLAQQSSNLRGYKVSEPLDGLVLVSQFQRHLVQDAFGSAIAIVFLVSGLMGALGPLWALGLKETGKIRV